MTRTQKTVFILVAIVALIMGLTVNKVLSGKGQGDPTALIDAGIILLPQSRQLPPVTMTNQDGQPVLSFVSTAFWQARGSGATER